MILPLLSQLLNVTLSKLEWLTWVTLWNSMKFIRRSRAPGWVDAATVCCLIWDVILENVCLLSVFRTMGVFASVSRQWCIKTVRLGRWTALRCLSSLKPSGGESVWVTASSCALALETSTNMMASKTLWAEIQNTFNKSRSIRSILHCFITCFKFSALFYAQDLEKISEYFKANYKVELVEKDMFVKGWNWGTAKFNGQCFPDATPFLRYVQYNFFL